MRNGSGYREGYFFLGGGLGGVLEALQISGLNSFNLIKKLKIIDNVLIAIFL